MAHALLILKRLKKQRGVVALEALLSLFLMLGAFYVMWGAALIIYNQSKLTTGTQFAAQGALVVYDRSTYRGGYPANGACNEGDGCARRNATAAARVLLRENGESGMALDQMTGESPTVDLKSISITCGNSISGTGPAYGQTQDPTSRAAQENACNTNIDTPAGAAVTYVQVLAEAQGSYWLLSPLNRANQTTTDGDQRHPLLYDYGVAISVSPDATP